MSHRRKKRHARRGLKTVDKEWFETDSCFFARKWGSALSCLSQKVLEYWQFGGAPAWLAHVGRQSPGMCEGFGFLYQEELCGRDSCSRHFSGLSSSADGEGEIPASGANRNNWLSVLKTAICRICISTFDSFESSIFLKNKLIVSLYIPRYRIWLLIANLHVASMFEWTHA